LQVQLRKKEAELQHAKDLSSLTWSKQVEHLESELRWTRRMAKRDIEDLEQLLDDSRKENKALEKSQQKVSKLVEITKREGDRLQKAFESTLEGLERMLKSQSEQKRPTGEFLDSIKLLRSVAEQQRSLIESREEQMMTKELPQALDVRGKRASGSTLPELEKGRASPELGKKQVTKKSLVTKSNFTHASPLGRGSHDVAQEVSVVRKVGAERASSTKILPKWEGKELPGVIKKSYEGPDRVYEDIKEDYEQRHQEEQGRHHEGHDSMPSLNARLNNGYKRRNSSKINIIELQSFLDGEYNDFLAWFTEEVPPKYKVRWHQYDRSREGNFGLEDLEAAASKYLLNTGGKVN